LTVAEAFPGVQLHPWPMIPGRSKKKKRVKLFVMNARVLKKRKKPPSFSPFTRAKLVKLAVMVSVLATCGYGGFAVGRHFLSDPEYAVNLIVVRGNETLSREDIINFSLLKEGENIFRARIYRAKKRLSELPLTERVAVSRFMPDTIVIEVVERRPRARLSGSKKFLADYSGVLLPYSSCQEPDRLPLIVGVDTVDLSVGDRCCQPEMTKEMRVLRLYESSSLADLAEVDGIDASRPDNLRLYLKQGTYTRRGSEFPLGGEQFGQRLAQLEVILRSVVEKHKKRIQWADLTQENVPVRF
jgi:cell division septal protein FtsQ